MLFDPDGRDPREGGKVLDINISNSTVLNSSHGPDAVHKRLNDRSLYDKADKEFFWGSIPSLAFRLLKSFSMPKNGSIPTKLTDKQIQQNLMSGTLSLVEKAEGFIAGSQSDKYTYSELEKTKSGLATKLVERTVENLGKGFEAEVTSKKEYSISYSQNEEGKLEAKATLSSITYYSLEKKGDNFFYKIATINVQADKPMEITHKKAEPRKDNTVK